MSLLPFSARSVVASTLLGTHPPRLPGRLLVALGNEFGISAGTTRVALSRMVDRGELVNDDGVYRLSGHLLERQARQDQSRQPLGGWEGAWECAIVVATGRTSSDRAQLRSALGNLRLGERREGVWMRPANLDPDRAGHARGVADTQVEWYRLQGIGISEGRRLTDRLFDLDEWAVDARLITDALQRAALGLDVDRTAHGPALTGAFTAAAAALRHFLHDPLLPAELEPEDWPAVELRCRFDELDGRLRNALRVFFASVVD